MDVTVVPLHKNTKYMSQCCKLINHEWQRSETARMRTLEFSSDNLPTNLILVQNNERVIGHLKLSPIPSLRDCCFIESVVIEKELRGMGYGTVLMKKAEDYCKNYLHLKSIYLSTRGQELFYTKLGYTECPPISIYGLATIIKLPSVPHLLIREKEQAGNIASIPPPTPAPEMPTPPPLPEIGIISNNSSSKTFMKKDISFS